MWFPIGGPLEPCIYLAPLRRYYAPKILGSRPWPFRVTWGHRSRDHRTRRVHFPIGGQWWLCAYLARVRRFRASKILGSRVWPFGVTWRHRSRDRDRWTMWSWVISHRLTVIVLLNNITFYDFSCFRCVVSYWWSIGTMRLSCTVTEILGPKIIGSRVWPFGVTWRHRSRDHWTWHMWFPIGGLLEPCVYLAPLRRYKASNLHLPMLKAKSSLRMLRVKCQVAGGG